MDKPAEKENLIAATERRFEGSPFPILTHSIMLRDRARLDGFRDAIRARVEDGMTVVDLGTGTGILASYAAERTSARVVGIEVEESSVLLARKIFAASQLRNVEIVKALSMRAIPGLAPDVLVGELLGPLGLEENTVELFYDFANRHPTVRHFIPMDVRVMAIAVQSETLSKWRDGINQSFQQASTSTFDYGVISRELDETLTNQVITSKAPDAAPCGDPVQLAHFELGRAKSSAFDSTFEVGNSCDFVHLYFESTLAPGISLSNHYANRESHWEHHFVCRRREASRLNIKFLPKERTFVVEWLD